MSLYRSKLTQFILMIMIFLISFSALSQNTKTTSSLFDLGKMWTFDYPPTKYFRDTYKFSPTNDWYEKARLSSIRIPGCSASFISEDGLVITNHHCARRIVDVVSKSNERLNETGFYAATPDEERKIPDYYADQLQLIEDVTEGIKKAFNNGKDDEEKVKLRDQQIKKIEQSYNEKTGLICNVVPFYNGGKYSLYGYKRYNDVRLVFAVENQMESLGGDYDNFTYPRYDMDFSIYRIYDENGKPLKTKNYFKVNPESAKEGENIFVIGNPGRTSRLFTVSQLEFNRDYVYPFNIANYQNQIDILKQYIENYPKEKFRYLSQLLGFSNSLKATQGYLNGLKDKELMARKSDFENKFKNTLFSKKELKEKYYSLWNEIDLLQKQRAEYFPLINSYNFLIGGYYFTLAFNLVTYAFEISKPENERMKDFSGKALETFKSNLNAINPVLDLELPRINFFLKILKNSEAKDDAIKNYFSGKSSEDIATTIFNSTILNKDSEVKDLLNNPEKILKSTDPFISIICKTYSQSKKSRSKYEEIMSKVQAKVQLLGNAIFETYGTEIPPDATFTLRIADGIIKGYEYNGTLAPSHTTFYGIYDRYYSFNRPEWELSPRWKTPPSKFDLSKPACFISTADIIGGNSGSPVINKNHEFVGLVFDGNIESLAGQFIFLEEKNRTIAVHAAGIMESLKNMYGCDRIYQEILAGKILK